MLARLVGLVAVAAALGCAGAMRPVGDRPRNIAMESHGRTRDVLTAEQLRTAASLSALEAIRFLRPEFFMTREPMERAPEVYLDGVYHGGLAALATVPLAVILEVKYLSASSASLWFGSHRPWGPVIAIRTRP